jgi:hypothetical protein
VLQNVDSEAFLILHDFLDHLVIAIHVYEKQIVRNQRQQQGQEPRLASPMKKSLNTFSVRWTHEVATVFGPSL